MAKLVLDGVTKRFGDEPVVNEVSLTIESGQFVALLGPSGCGKTTILRSIAGFEQLDDGLIALDNDTISSRVHHVAPELRQMSMVFQSYALWPHMNVMDNVGYSLKLKGVNGGEYKRRVNESLEAVKMEHLLHRMPSELSGGQRQRVALARCLVSSPKVVLLDEPLANLDRHLRASMEQIFREFHQRSGTTFVYVTHDQAEAMALADQVAVMNQGKIVQFDSPENLYRFPDCEWTARFIGQGSIVYSYTKPMGNGRNLHGEDVMNALNNQPKTKPANAQYHAILVRPQHIRPLISENAQDVSQQSVKGRIIDRVFKGERYHYQTEILGNQHIEIYSEDKLLVGQELQLCIEKGYLLRS
ncbi:MAG: ABC transporter ATP-binding protein [Alcaligenaceae bacterium]|nr:ABC transporter ATP-binding protein [Alcaligenaceae bacterium]